MALGFGLTRVDEGDVATKSRLKNLDQLRGEGYLGDEKYCGEALCEGLGGHLEVDIGLAATSDAMEETSVFWGLLEVYEGLFLRII